MAIFCFTQWKTKMVQSIWNLSWLFLVWLVPTAIPHSRAKSKCWTSGRVTECKRQWKPIWREIWVGLFQKVINTTFCISNSGKRWGRNLSHCTQRCHSLFGDCYASAQNSEAKYKPDSYTVQHPICIWLLVFEFMELAFCFGNEGSDGKNRRTFKT